MFSFSTTPRLKRLTASLGSFFFFFHDTATTEIYTLSLHDALPIPPSWAPTRTARAGSRSCWTRSEEHTAELQSRVDLVCRLLLEKKKRSASRYALNQKKTENPSNVTETQNM